MPETDNYQLYAKRQYFETLTQRFEAATARSRILMMSMAFEPDEPEVIALWSALESAAARGAHVKVGIDARSFLDNNGRPDPAWYRSSKLGPLWYHKQLPAQLRPPYQAKIDCIKRLGEFPNAKVVITNTPEHRFSLPFGSRSHIKIALVDDEIFLGGCNLGDLEFIDPMVGWQSAKAADELYGLLSGALKIGNIRRALEGIDRTIAVSPGNTIYIDAGVPGQSLIYDNALALIDSAQQWLTITCQYFPNGRTAQHLQRAMQRGVKVQILFSHPSHHGLVGGLIQRVSILLERRRLPASMFHGMQPRDVPLIHAKLIACDRGVMIGSHNYVQAGVQLGTAEIAVLSRDTNLAKRAVEEIRASLPTLR